MLTSDYTVIGSGIIGLMTARELAKQGASVTLFERAELARSASWAGGGILSPLNPASYPEALQPLVKYGQQAYPFLVDCLLESTGIDAEYLRSGYLHVADSVDPDYLCGDSQSLVESLHLPNHSLGHKSVAWYPSIAQIRNSRLLKALLVDVKNYGVTLHAHAPIKSLKIQQGKVTAIRTEVAEWPVNKLVLCAGAWTRSLLAANDAKNDIATTAIRPVRGQMLLLDAPLGWLDKIVKVGDVYLIPRKDGSTLLGSTLEATGYDDNPNEAGAARLLSLAEPYFPTINNIPIKLQWAGLRPGSDEGVPIISQHPQWQNCWVNAGHHRNGLLLAPASAKLCANLLLDQKPCIDPEPYRL